MKHLIPAVVILLVAAFVLPWRNINWGRMSLTPTETVTVNGEAKSIQKNQIASFTAGVGVVNDNKEVAVKEVNTKVEALLKTIKDFGVKPEDIKTQNLNIYQNQEMYYDNGVQKSRKGQWSVNNSLEITLRNVDNAAKLTDLLSSSGATNVYGPNFRFDDTGAIEKTLFDGAMKDAKDKAEIIAKASGRKLGKVVSVNEGSGSNNVYSMFAKADTGMGGAPVEVGSGTVSKSLTVSFELN